MYAALGVANVTLGYSSSYRSALNHGGTAYDGSGDGAASHARIAVRRSRTAPSADHAA